MGYKPRVFHNYGEGRIDVFPIKMKDFDEMARLCLVYRDRASPGSKTYYKWFRNYMILILGVNTGCRIEVLLQLTPKNLQGGCCRITEYKTNKISRYDLSDQVFALVENYIKEFNVGQNDYLFRTSRLSERPLTRQAAYQIIRKLGKVCGIKYSIGCHSLRKSFGRWTYDETHDIHLVQRLLGHSSPIITQQYICLEEEFVSRQRKKTAYGLKNSP